MDRPYLRAAYDTEAATYDERFRDLQWPKFETFLEPLSATPEEHGPILDIGCGTGLLLEYFTILGHSRADIIGVDLSHEMLRRSKARGGVVAQAEMHALPFATASIGTIVCVTVFRIIPGQDRRVLAEMARVLRPSGQLIISLLAERDDDQVVGLLAEAGFTVTKRLRAGQDIGYLAYRI